MDDDVIVEKLQAMVTSINNNGDSLWHHRINTLIFNIFLC